jgi:hypothetical protein
MTRKAPTVSQADIALIARFAREEEASRQARIATKTAPLAEVPVEAPQETGEQAQHKFEEIPQEHPQEVPPSESAGTSRDFSKKSKKVPKSKWPGRRCRGLKKDGGPCRAWALAAGDLCIYHEADATTHFSEAQSRGGRARPAVDQQQLDFDFIHPASFQAFVEGLMRMQLAGAIPTRQLAAIHKTLRFAERNLERVEKHLDEDDCHRYFHRVEKVVATASELSSALEGRDTVERTQAIDDVGSKREEFLQANDRHAPSPRRSPSPSSPSFDSTSWAAMRDEYR